MYEGAIQDLIDELGRLPGIGPKSAQRLAFHLLQADTDILEYFCNENEKDQIHLINAK